MTEPHPDPIIKFASNKDFNFEYVMRRLEPVLSTTSPLDLKELIEQEFSQFNIRKGLKSVAYESLIDKSKGYEYKILGA